MFSCQKNDENAVFQHHETHASESIIKVGET